MILGDILHKPNQNSERRTLGLIVVSCYIALVITNFAWMYPILTGIPISQATWNMQIWLPQLALIRALEIVRLARRLLALSLRKRAISTKAS